MSSEGDVVDGQTIEMRAMHDAKEGDLVSIEVGRPSTAVMIGWLESWCERLGHGARLELEGEIGFGRECVGILCEGQYPEYSWWDTKDRQFANGDIWSPDSAYHKDTFMAVLGRGDDAVRDLYLWGRWFDARRFTLSVIDLRMGSLGGEVTSLSDSTAGRARLADMMLGKRVRLVRPAEVPHESDEANRFLRMRQLMECSPAMDDDLVKEILEGLIDEAERAAEWRPKVEAQVEEALAKLETISTSVDHVLQMMEMRA